MVTKFKLQWRPKQNQQTLAPSPPPPKLLTGESSSSSLSSAIKNKSNNSGKKKNNRRRQHNQRWRPKPNPQSQESYRNWSEDLPWPALSLIMKKIGGIEVLMTAQWVCRSWWKVSLDPCLWKVTDLRGHADLFNMLDMAAMAKVAVDRSDGLMEEFLGEYVGSDELLTYIADRTKILKRLQLIAAYDVSDKGLIEAVSRFPLLEELDLTHCSFAEEVCQSIGLACPRLKCFRYNSINSKFYLPYEEEEDEFGNFSDDAFGIANTMPELRQLQLVGNSLTNEGLKAILDKCIHLETLDIRRCFQVNLDAELKSKCGKIKELRLPNDSIEDYGWTFEDEYDGSELDFPDYGDDDLSYEDYFEIYRMEQLKEEIGEFDFGPCGYADLFDDFFDDYY